jgi:hypothetical protein
MRPEEIKTAGKNEREVASQECGESPGGERSGDDRDGGGKEAARRQRDVTV